jgi:hypothetical protein
LLCRFEASVAYENYVLAVENDRLIKSELSNRFGNFTNLLRVMVARVLFVWRDC